MKRAIILSFLLLGGCMTRAERMAAGNEWMDRQCLSYGAQRGTDAYVACRAQLATAPPASAICTTNGNTTFCH